MLLGIDIGGTFTDGYYVDEKSKVTTVKALSTPEDDFVTGFFDCLEEIASRVGKNGNELTQGLARLVHGSTVATNAIIQDRLAKTGVITSKGHKDVLKEQLGRGRSMGRPADDCLKVILPKPEPIVPTELTEEVSERVDHKGKVIVGLNESEVENATRSLLDKGVEVIAICFLWSFLNPSHEVRAKEIVNKIKRDIFITCSHEVVPKLGEYQRFTATVINALVQPVTSAYVEKVRSRLEGPYGYRKPFYVMGCDGGLRSWEEVKTLPIYTIGSGPVGGAAACKSLSDRIHEPNLIGMDMGGTSFDVAIISKSTPLMKDTSVVKQYEYFISMCDVTSVGAGGGSIAWYDEVGRTIRVGPQSAGASPGPACYNLGGTEPTVTDANLILGYLNPKIKISGKKVDKERAVQAMTRLGKRIGKDAVGMASGVFDLVNEEMGLKVRSEMISRGLDYRLYKPVSFGGAGALHLTEILRLLGTKTGIVPSHAAVMSASGVCHSDLRVETTKEVVYEEPFDPQQINTDFAELESSARAKLRTAGISEEDIVIERGFDMKYHLQFHKLMVPVSATGELTNENLGAIVSEFDRIYSSRYGEVALIPEVMREITVVRLIATGSILKIQPLTSPTMTERVPDEAVLTPRQFYSKEKYGFVESKVYDGTKLVPGNKIVGAALIDFPDTTIRLAKGDRATVDRYHNFNVEII